MGHVHKPAAYIPCCRKIVDFTLLCREEIGIMRMRDYSCVTVAEARKLWQQKDQVSVVFLLYLSILYWCSAVFSELVFIFIRAFTVGIYEASVCNSCIAVTVIFVYFNVMVVEMILIVYPSSTSWFKKKN